MIRSALQPRARRLAALAAPLLALATLGLATPAQAATAPSVTAFCDSGYGTFSCGAIASGGSGSYGYNWTAVQNAGFVSGTTTDSADGKCRINYAASVQVTVTDLGTGATTTRQAHFFCYATAP
ncbi:hypothetical protein [Kitasatospora sp. NPDC097643]|uniref:hypothetical protein n=1 Tax=Kitasatospora sp. NPDC097643 TaxID=3157230 RepID=UPI00331BE464